MRNSHSFSAASDASSRMASIRMLTACLLAAMFVVVAPAANAATPAESFVQDNINKGYAILNDSTLTPPQRSDRFRGLLLNIMDARRIALFTLGSYARGAKDSDVQDFSNAFADFVTAMLQHDLGSNPGEIVTVTGSAVRAADDVVVTARLTGSTHTNGAQINMGFRVRKRANGADALTDLQVEGVSMAMAQRSDFNAWLQQHHGDVAGLTKELRSRAQYFRDRSVTGQEDRTAAR